MSKKYIVFVIYHQGNFDDLMRRAFRVISKIKITNLCKVVHDVRIIPALSDPFNQESVERKE